MEQDSLRWEVEFVDILAEINDSIVQIVSSASRLIQQTKDSKEKEKFSAISRELSKGFVCFADAVNERGGGLKWKETYSTSFPDLTTESTEQKFLQALAETVLSFASAVQTGSSATSPIVLKDLLPNVKKFAMGAKKLNTFWKRESFSVFLFRTRHSSL
jgi:hypothetical protein